MQEIGNVRFLSVVFIVFLAGCGQTLPDGDTDLSFKYRCESGQIIKASYPMDSKAIVDYDGHRLEMKIAVSASGARYVGEGLEWWTKGTGAGAPGTLFHHREDGTSGAAIERCTQLADTAQ